MWLADWYDSCSIVALGIDPMSLDCYLIQYTPELERHERFNVGVIVKINEDLELRLLSDEQWLDRFTEGTSRKGESNWKAWSNYYRRELAENGLSSILHRSGTSNYNVIHAMQRIFGKDPEDIEAFADQVFEELVL